MVGGKRRVDRVLAPGFTDGLGDLGLEEVRERRDLCRSEREYLSFLRRLVQGRRDILQAELERRRRGEEPGSLVERLVAILAEAPEGTSRGEAPIVSLPEEEIALARRRVERLVSDARLSNLTDLSDRELEEAIARMDEEERGLSDVRARVMAVHDVLQAELVRRYRDQLGSARG